jgi:uncharacterized protein (TIGR02246 family)
MSSMLSVTGVAAALFASAPADRAAANAAINAVYARLAAARAGHSVDGMVAAFAPDGLLVDARPGPAIAGAELAARLAPMAARLREEGVDLSTQYRIERRSFAGDLAIDAGYMRQAMTRPGAAEPMVRYARFLVTLRRSPDGSWRILSDAAMPSNEAAWNAVPRIDGLHYDG